jgi:hypothetical protein
MLPSRLPFIAYSTTKAHEAIGCAPRAVKSALANGELHSRRVGRRTFILAEELQRWAASRPIARRNNHKDTDHG